MPTNQKTVPELLIGAYDYFCEKQLPEAAEIMEARKWRYHNSTGEFATIGELRYTLVGLLSAAIKQHCENVAAGKPEKEICIQSGRFAVRVEFFSRPVASISFGLQYSEQ